MMREAREAAWDLMVLGFAFVSLGLFLALESMGLIDPPTEAQKEQFKRDFY